MSNALWLDSLDIGPVEDDGRRRTFQGTIRKATFGEKKINEAVYGQCACVY